LSSAFEGFTETFNRCESPTTKPTSCRANTTPDTATGTGKDTLTFTEEDTPSASAFTVAEPTPTPETRPFDTSATDASLDDQETFGCVAHAGYTFAETFTESPTDTFTDDRETDTDTTGTFTNFANTNPDCKPSPSKSADTANQPSLVNPVTLTFAPLTNDPNTSPPRSAETSTSTSLATTVLTTGDDNLVTGAAHASGP